MTTALKAASVWAGGSGGYIATQRACPDAGGGSLCVVWQKQTALGAVTGCGVFCYTGPYERTLMTTSTAACPCPDHMGTDWY